MEPRGYSVALENGGLPEKRFSSYLLRLIEQTGGESGPIGLQFIANPQAEATQGIYEQDPQEEHLYGVPGVEGMIYKYKGSLDEYGNVKDYGRVLWTISHHCDAYCRYCFRGRQVGVKNTGGINDRAIDAGISFLEDNKEINEVILSGGDPFITQKSSLQRIVLGLADLQYAGKLDHIRIHTRAPVTNPQSIESRLDLIEKLHNLEIVLQINHPAEITEELCEVVDKMKKRGASLFSQSVLLRGVNDNADTLVDLFNTLRKAGITPYYLHQIDPVSWAKRFEVPFSEAISLWQSIRPRLSGMAATAKFVIDSPHGAGKIVVPEAGWDVQTEHFYDFKGKKINIVDTESFQDY